MAKRPVYIVSMRDALVDELYIDFDWYSGFAITQKQKSIKSLHENFVKDNKDKKVLEISSKSPTSLGVSLSAFNLMINKKNSEEKFSVECAFQSSKVFENGGPYKELLSKSSLEAKKYDKLTTSGDLINFQYNNVDWELEPKTLFYDWLYITALSLDINKDLATQLLEYNAFTDIEFNPKKSVNCQAYSAALYVSLYRRGLLQKALTSIDEYKKVVLTTK
ncbi:hypothetical protein AN639_07075 [Candidatus Epulonipiscium fishelsonii]|uniref:Uncharacterized protein n=1 Tax=Candidatus Epulonipiscium fishelsonii TaxID=77094 RepID=A0ACC8XGJ7_9FIRM|nr:hypothetical protein AN639_07075 [Epulopiscium sp. SCG-B05WGA-EpuloA1]ONI42743.1 hypothetical protein AN396_13150 [Epulopiscium sp. SCG-B11WGA-EpuloA1]